MCQSCPAAPPPRIQLRASKGEPLGVRVKARVLLSSFMAATSLSLPSLSSSRQPRERESGGGCCWLPPPALWPERRGEGGAGVNAPPTRESTRSGPGRERVGSSPAALGPPRGPRFPGDPGARLPRGPRRPESASGARPALLRRAYLGHGCLRLGPALGHRLMPRGAGHSRPGGMARSSRPPPPGRECGSRRGEPRAGHWARPHAPAGSFNPSPPL